MSLIYVVFTQRILNGLSTIPQEIEILSIDYFWFLVSKNYRSLERKAADLQTGATDGRTPWTSPILRVPNGPGCRLFLGSIARSLWSSSLNGIFDYLYGPRTRKLTWYTDCDAQKTDARPLDKFPPEDPKFYCYKLFGPSGSTCKAKSSSEAAPITYNLACYYADVSHYARFSPPNIFLASDSVQEARASRTRLPYIPRKGSFGE